jgi:hypothetical protein
MRGVTLNVLVVTGIKWNDDSCVVCEAWISCRGLFVFTVCGMMVGRTCFVASVQRRFMEVKGAIMLAANNRRGNPNPPHPA